MKGQSLLSPEYLQSSCLPHWKLAAPILSRCWNNPECVFCQKIQKPEQKLLFAIYFRFLHFGKPGKWSLQKWGDNFHPQCLQRKRGIHTLMENMQNKLIFCLTCPTGDLWLCDEQRENMLERTLGCANIISIAKRCSYNSPAQRSQPIPSHPYPSTYSSGAEKGQTEQNQNAGVR